MACLTACLIPVAPGLPPAHLILGYSLLSAYRVYKNSDIPIHFTSSGRDVRLIYRTTFD